MLKHVGSMVRGQARLLLAIGLVLAAQPLASLAIPQEALIWTEKTSGG